VPSQILGKTGYEMATHPAESTDWLNVLGAQVSIVWIVGRHALIGRSSRDIGMICYRMEVRRGLGKRLKSG